MLTKSGTTLGTVPYMSPEQVHGDMIDRRTDIWSMGVILYEMITGQRPFKSEYETALVYSFLNEEPEAVTGLRSGVPMDLERIVEKCLQKDPTDRYQHTDELIVDLRKVEQEITSGIRSRPSREDSEKGAESDIPTSGTKFSVTMKIVMTAAVLLVIIVIRLIFYNQFTTVSEIPGPISLSQITFASGVDEYPAWSPDGTRLAFNREVAGYRNIWIKDLNTGSERQITNTNTDNIQPVWSPDGSALLFVRANQSHGKIGLSDIYGRYVLFDHFRPSGGNIWLAEGLK